MSEPFTVAHFRSWCSQLTLDTGKPWALEKFQAEFARDVFAGHQECWLVIPEGNAKTTLLAGLVLYHTQFTPDGMVVVAAAARDQAEWLFQAAAGFVRRSDAIRGRFRCQEGFRRIRHDSNGSRIQIWAADERTADGARFTMAVCEELHRHRDLGLYRTWRGKLEKRGGQLVAISTAGEPEGEFEAVRKAIRDGATQNTRKGAHLRAVNGTTVLHEYAVPETGNPDDMRQVKQANPLKAVTIASLRRKYRSPSMNPAHWRRFTCGMPARLNAPFPPEMWDRCKVDIGGLEPGDEVVLAVRFGAAAGIGIVAPRSDERVAVGIRYVPPPADGRVPFNAMEALLTELCETYDVAEIDYDPRQLEAGAEILEDRGFPMVKVPQSPARLAPATGTLWRLISGGLLMHDGDPELRRQVLAVHTRETLEGWRLDPDASTSAVVALAMACHEAAKPLDPTPVVVLPRVG